MNGIIIIDKPSGWTSNDVVCKLRGVFHERRIGHGGTLDPMATGVLPVFVGRATRAVEFCEADEKEYVAGIKLGITTDTQDTTGTVLSKRDASGVSADDVKRVLSEFLGEQEQLPPMYSAVKVNGRKLYELARKGIEIERKPRPITVSGIELLSAEADEYIIRAAVSKGTYIRTLVNDIGERLGCGAAMSSLRRIRSGVFTGKEAMPLEAVIAAGENGTAGKLLRPTESLFSSYPAYTVCAENEKLCRNGNSFSAGIEDGSYRVYAENGEFLMLGRAENGEMRTVKSFFEVK